MTNRKNKDGILIFFDTIERHVAAVTTRYHQLMQTVRDRAANQWVTYQKIDRLFNQRNRFCRCQRININQEIG